MQIFFFLNNWETFFFKTFILFLERGEGREKERERNINEWLPLTCPPIGDPARNPGMRPDQESNQQLLVRRPALSPLSYTSQGQIFFIRLFYLLFFYLFSGFDQLPVFLFLYCKFSDF